jgi:hypothetical protein
MRFRLTAFGLHLLGSACALTLILGGLYLGWYRWPGWYLTGAARVLIIVGIVDLGLGPTLTLVVANPKKPRRALARDVAIIVAVQIAALLYGAATLWKGRPLYYTYSADRLEMVQASDLKVSEIRRAEQENPTFAPHWYSTPRWVWARLPDDPKEAANIVNSHVLGNGQDVIEMPRYFRAWDECLPLLRQALTSVEDIKYLSRKEKESLKQRMLKQGLQPDRPNAVLMWGIGSRLVAVFDLQTQRMRALLKP